MIGIFLLRTNEMSDWLTTTANWQSEIRTLWKVYLTCKVRLLRASL